MFLSKVDLYKTGMRTSRLYTYSNLDKTEKILYNKPEVSCVKVNDLTSQRFGSLLVIERRGSDKRGEALWLCRCDCGTEKVIRGHDLKGGTKSCGCSRRTSTNLYKHGLSHTHLHGLWRNIKDRCYNKNNHHYSIYGGKGVKMCEEWKNDFAKFYEWSYKNGYMEGLTLDRIDFNGDYCPENCRWTTWTQQANNTSRNIRVTINGETKTVAEWSRIYGVNYHSVHSRIFKGMDPLLAITTPFDKTQSRRKKKPAAEI